MQADGLWGGLLGVSALLTALALSHWGGDFRAWLAFPPVLAGLAVAQAYRLERVRSPLRSWPMAIGLLLGFTFTSSVLAAGLDVGDDISDVRGSNFWLFAPFIAPLACGPAVIALVVACRFFRSRTRP